MNKVLVSNEIIRIHKFLFWRDYLMLILKMVAITGNFNSIKFDNLRMLNLFINLKAYKHNKK